MTADLLILCARLRSFDRTDVRPKPTRGPLWPRLVCLLGAIMPSSGIAQDQPNTVPARPEQRDVDRRIGGATESAEPCVQVDIAGHRAGHLDCAAARLEAAARIARSQGEAARSTPIAGAGSPDVQVGVASLPGSRLRMGRNLGVSVRPDRPIVTPVNPMGPRR